VGFAGTLPLFVEEEGADGTVYLQTAPEKRRLFNAQRFPRKKASGTYRVFCLGGSTTHGRPYDDTTSFCGWLRELLPRVAPDRRWEVVNAGGVSYASYRVALLMEELTRYQPDLFIVYTGHNEFLERRTYRGLIAMPRTLRGLGAVASRTRVWAVLRAAWRTLGSRRGASRPATGTDTARAGEPSPLAAEVTTLLDAAVGPDAYERDDPWRAQVVRHYAFNLARMTDIAASVEAGVVLVTPAANLRDSSPFKSLPREDLTPAEAARWAALYGEAGTAAARDDPAAAHAALERAVAIDDRHAQTQYARGRALYALGRFEEARRAFERARDEDVCPLRAPREVVAATRRVAAERGIPLVDFEKRVRDEAPHGIPGNEHFLDHVHPTLDAHRDLALDLLATMRQLGALPAAARWEPSTIAAAESRIANRVDPRAHGQALVNLSKVLGWAGKLEESAALALRAIERGPELAEAHYQAGVTAQLLGRPGEAIGHYRRALGLAPRVATAHGNLAAAYEAEGRTLLAIRHYRRAIELLGPGRSPYRDRLVATLEQLGATAE
jgi:tetratricopeptide (TPR) repeat protein